MSVVTRLGGSWAEENRPEVRFATTCDSPAASTKLVNCLLNCWVGCAAAECERGGGLGVVMVTPVEPEGGTMKPAGGIEPEMEVDVGAPRGR